MGKKEHGGKERARGLGDGGGGQVGREAEFEGLTIDPALMGWLKAGATCVPWGCWSGRGNGSRHYRRSALHIQFSTMVR